MRVQVAGRQIDVGDALRSRIETELEAGIIKYFGRPTDGAVTVARNGIGFEVDCQVHLASGITLQSQGHGGDAHAAFDDALTKLEKRVRRYKRRLKNHHADNKSPLPAQDAAAYVLAPFEGDDDAAADGQTAATAMENGVEGGPLVIAEATVPVKTMTVSMAVLQLEVADQPALLFRNAGHGGLNVVYRRPDGNIGWIDPARADAKAASG
ncbi:MAG: ribosome-associated translation inhibitor RaiA [Alphaproteobacteria bacterium]|nr:ribosome-associated translation inhibitor RaiA [Alphaproteobacteria bacterium]